MSLAMSAAPFEGVDNNSIEYNNQNYRKKQHNKTQRNVVKDMLNPDKVNSVLQSIHASLSDPIGASSNQMKGFMNEEVDGNSLGDYYSNPPPNPMSIGSQRASFKEGMQVVSGTNDGSMSDIQNPNPNTNDEDLDLNNFSSNYHDDESAHDYYKKFVPNFNPNMMMKTNTAAKSIPYYSASPSTATTTTTTNSSANSPLNHYAQNPDFKPSQIQTQSTTMYGDNHDVLIQKLNYMINLLEEKQDERTNNVTEEVVLYSFLGIFMIFIVDSFTRVGKYTR